MLTPFAKHLSIQKGRNRTKMFLTIAFNHYLENYLFNFQKFGKQKAIFLPVIYVNDLSKLVRHSQGRRYIVCL